MSIGTFRWLWRGNGAKAPANCSLGVLTLTFSSFDSTVLPRYGRVALRTQYRCIYGERFEVFYRRFG